VRAAEFPLSRRLLAEDPPAAAEKNPGLDWSVINALRSRGGGIRLSSACGHTVRD